MVSDIFDVGYNWILPLSPNQDVLRLDIHVFNQARMNSVDSTDEAPEGTFH